MYSSQMSAYVGPFSGCVQFLFEKTSILIRGHMPPCEHSGSSLKYGYGLFVSITLPHSPSLSLVSQSLSPLSFILQRINLWSRLVSRMWVTGMWVGLETWLLAVRECAWGGSISFVYRLSVMLPAFNICLTPISPCPVYYTFLKKIPVILVGS